MYLSSKELSNIVPYTAGLTPEFVTAKYNLPIDKVSKLGSAENHFGASPKATAAITATLGKLSVYPEWSARALREKIGEKYNYNPEQVICGAGETEIMSWIIRAFASAGDKLLMHEPCFPVYHKIAAAEGRVPVYQPMGDDFEFHFDDFIAKITTSVRVIFLTSPHSPTGKMLGEKDVRRVCEAGRNAIVILDEAYVHFSGTEGYLHLAKEYDNLIVLRTFSKVFGLGGLRVGFGVCHSAVTAVLMRIKPAWNLGQLQIAGATAALGDDEHVQKSIVMITEMRDFVLNEIRKLNRFHVIEGTRANFFLLKLPEGEDSTDTWNALLKKGVIVKDGNVDFRGLEKGYLRIDIAPKPHMERLIKALASL